MAINSTQEQGTFYDFMYPKYLLKRMFGVDQHDLDYLEDAYMVWRDIGNIAASIHAFEVVVGEDGYVTLPCNCEFIESVSTGAIPNKDKYSDLIIWYDNTNVVVNPNSYLVDVKLDDAFLLSKINNTELHPEGHFIDYEVTNHVGIKKLRVSRDLINTKISIIYRGIIIDDKGNPCLTRKESEAIAYKINFIETQLATYKGDPIKSRLLSTAMQESNRKMQAAKIPEYLSQNFIDQILQAKTRHDRKVFNSSYKTLR